jgi:NADPH2:quinone reductase
MLSLSVEIKNRTSKEPPMKPKLPDVMKAIALNQFGGAEEFIVQTVPIPALGPNNVLIRVRFAGVGEWDPFERSGGYEEALENAPTFPYILGSEGAGIVAAVGENVTHVQEGDPVYAARFLNPTGGFYAEYAVVEGGYVSHLPDGLPLDQGSVIAGVGITALRGLEDTLHLKQGESLMIFGASGGVGHIAIQIAKQMGARVLAVASGEDGVRLAERLGADSVINGRNDDVLAAIRAFAPDGLDTALLTAGTDEMESMLDTLRDGGRVVYPNGIQPEPQQRPHLEITGYHGLPDPEITKRFKHRMESGSTPFQAHVAHLFLLENAADAHEALDSHYLGKLVLQIE